MIDLFQTRVSIELNRFVRRVTAWGTVGLGWTVITGFYGMNVVESPGASGKRKLRRHVAHMEAGDRAPFLREEIREHRESELEHLGGLDAPEREAPRRPQPRAARPRACDRRAGGPTARVEALHPRFRP